MTDPRKRKPRQREWQPPFTVNSCSILLLGIFLFVGCSRSTPNHTISASATSSDTVLRAATSSKITSSNTDDHRSNGRDLDPIAEARDLLQTGQWDAAIELATAALLQDPSNAQAKLLACEAQAGLGNPQAAIDLAISIGVQSPCAAEAAIIHVEQLLILRQSIAAATVALQATRSLESVSPQLRHTAWHALNRVGRREEASWQADELCRAGEATREEMFSLIQRTESFPATGVIPQDVSTFFAPGLGRARWHYTQGDFDKSLSELAPQFERKFESAAACALFGRLLGETQRLESFAAWHASCSGDQWPQDIEDLGDYWAALGTVFLEQRQYEASTRALMEAVYRNPSDRRSLKRLGKSFVALNRPDEGAQFQYRAKQQQQTEDAAHEIMQALALSTEQLVPHHKLTRMLLKLDRPLEAMQWTLLHLSDSRSQQRKSIEQQRTNLLKDKAVFRLPSESTMLKIDRFQFNLDEAMQPLKTAQPAARNRMTNDQIAILADPRLENVAMEVGIEFQWYQDVDINLVSIPIHESLGGGIGVLDYDLDGWPDVYLAQGSGEPPTDQCTRSNILMRNTGGRFANATHQANAADHNYSSGIAAGDVNQDGFPDLLLGSLGHNRLLINNGDGSFRDATASLDNTGSVEDRFTASLAIADINGDGLPELFEANYIEMDGAFTLPEKGDDGGEELPSPTLHDAAADRWFENLGDGRFRSHEISPNIATPGTGLGVLITDFDANGTNEIFVGNDVRPNHFLFHQGQNQLLNAASVKGVASGFRGVPNGCMGIAAADFNRDGAIDLHITNYEHESANFYVQALGGAFTDLAIRYGIQPLSSPYVGFGTKAVDLDRNGWMDLIVANGHIFDLREAGREFFQMPPQMLMCRGRHFELAEVNDVSGYWSGQYLGRTIASLDFDRDGAIDFLVGHLDQPLALLRNGTRTTGQWIQIELVGTQSERDAVGARLVISMNDGTQFTHWVTAGDGYLCSDEPVLDFGVGEQSKVQKLEVFWTSGTKQTFTGIKARRRYLIIEGNQQPIQRQVLSAAEH